MSDQKKTVGIIGAGAIVFKSHLPLLRAIGADIRWILDANPDRAASVAEAWQIPAAFGADQLSRASAVDIALIACPYGVREPYYQFLRDKEAALFIEKPVARSVAELERICSMRPDYAIAAGFLRRSFGITRIVKSVIESGLFGNLRRIRSEFGTATVISSGASFAKKAALAGGGQLFESAIHNVDAICYAAGIERARIRQCHMEAEGGFDLHTEANLELTDAAGRGIDFELLVTCFQNTQYEIEMEFDRAVMTFSLFKKKLPTVRHIGRSGAFQLTDPFTADYPRNIFDVLHLFWTDFLSGVEARAANYTSARASVATASIMEQIYAAGLKSAAAPPEGVARL